MSAASQISKRQRSERRLKPNDDPRMNINEEKESVGDKLNEACCYISNSVASRAAILGPFLVAMIVRQIYDDVRAAVHSLGRAQTGTQHSLRARLPSPSRKLRESSRHRDSDNVVTS